MAATGALIDALKPRAGRMPRCFIEAAQQLNAMAGERAFGEAAQLILRAAEARA